MSEVCGVGRKENRDSGFLDWLAAECACDYLSDLRLRETAPPLLRVIGRIPPGRWPAEAWREAVYYITGVRDLSAGEAEARSALERWLKIKK